MVLTLFSFDGWGQISTPHPIQPPAPQKVKLYGVAFPHRIYTFWNFQTLQNTETPGPAYLPGTSTPIINSEFGAYATWFLDIGDNDGYVGKQAFRIMVAHLNPNGVGSTYQAIEVYDATRTNIISTSLGRVDGKACYGPGGLIYFTTYSPMNSTIPGYLIVFNPAVLTATAYPFPENFGLPYTLNAAPTPNANVVSTLIYGGTFNKSNVWWFDPANTAAGIQFISYNTGIQFPEIDPRQNYVDNVIGRGNWIYVEMYRRGIEGGAYSSVYAINIVTKIKYLLFHSTQHKFSLIDIKDPTTNQNIVALKMDHGMTPGTIYTNPVAIPLNTDYPAGMSTNCPCYNVAPLQTNGLYHQNIRPFIIGNYSGHYFDYANPFQPFYNGTKMPVSSRNPFENTSFNYNQNYALPRTNIIGGTTTTVDPPRVGDATTPFICDRFLNNNAYINLPWDLMENFDKVPNADHQYTFRLNGKDVDVTNVIETSSTNNLVHWNSYDLISYIPKIEIPKTSWDEKNKILYYKFDNFPLQVMPILKQDIYPIQFPNATTNNGLQYYIPNVSGLAMTANSGQGSPSGIATTLIKAVRNEGFSKIYSDPVGLFGYSITYLEKLHNDANDVLTIAEDQLGHEFGTNIVAGYPGGIDIYNANKPSTYTNLCYSGNNTTLCNPRRICSMGSLRKTINISHNNITKYGPETPAGVRLYSPDYYTPLLNNTGLINYRIVTVGVPNRGRQGYDIAIGMQDFTVDQNPANNVNTITLGDFDVLDFHDVSSGCGDFDKYHASCLANAPTNYSCSNQGLGALRYINSPYNDGVGYYNTNGSSTCPSQYLGMAISVRSLTNNLNEIWFFDPYNKTIYNKITMPDYLSQVEPITDLTTVGEMLVAKAIYQLPSAISPNTNQKYPVIFMFQPGNFAIEPGTLKMYSNPDFKNIHKIFVTNGSTNIPYQQDNNLFKIFVHYNNDYGTANLRIACIDLDGELNTVMNRMDMDFTRFTEYDYSSPSPNNVAFTDKILDFAYVPNDNAAMQDLLMVGGQNLYILHGVVPHVTDIDLVIYGKHSVKNISLQAHPNPFTNQITLISKNIQSGYYTVTLSDQMGRRLQHQRLYFTSNTPTRLNVPSNLAKGVYIVQVANQQTRQTIKVEKQ